MNSVVFVLIVFAGHTWVPTLEFKSEEKCQRAAQVLYDQLDERMSMGRPNRPWCLKIEK